MAFGNRGGHGDAPMAEINIIPLCDVLLVLLIIFMVTAPALSHQIDLTLPQPAPPPIERLTPPDPIRLRIDAAGDYMCLTTAEQTLILRETMKDMERRLDPRKFQRVHRSTIVNLDNVRQVKPHTNGECFLTLASGATVKVSRSYRDVVARFL